MDILKYGADVEVLAPRSLREAVATELARAGARYGGAGPTVPQGAGDPACPHNETGRTFHPNG